MAARGLQSIPSVNRLLTQPALARLASTYTQRFIKQEVVAELSSVRELVSSTGGDAPSLADLTARIEARIQETARPGQITAINATGIVLHTGLGRSKLAQPAVDAMAAAGSMHTNLEIDTETGSRGCRQAHVDYLLCDLTGAEAAAVVNNCAGAVVLAISALAAGKEVILSRGEMIEIGGQFRMPEIICAAGASLIEVGTTNRTRAADYRRAISDRTALILRCHPSNYQVVGFTEEVTSAELTAVGKEYGIPVMEDQGSGAIISPAQLGLNTSHGSLPHSVQAGFDLITASGDKLMGANQAGILLGKRVLIDRLMAHPLARALRVDKLTLAALEATLRIYRSPARAIKQIPTLKYLTRSTSEIDLLASRLCAALQQTLSRTCFEVIKAPSFSQAGGGSLPGDTLATVCVSIRPLTSCCSVNRIAASMRNSRPPVFGRINEDAFLLDPRTIEPEEIEPICMAASRLNNVGEGEAR